MTNKIDVHEIIKILEGCLPTDRDSIALHEPCFSGNEWQYVKECLDTGWVSSAGKYVDKFEHLITEFTGVRRAVAVVNGTAALHIALKLAGVEENDEVLIPALTFIATANAVAYCGAIPHFIDSEEKTLGIDPFKLRIYLKEIAVLQGNGCFNKKNGHRIKALVPMHTFGHPVDLDPLAELASQYKLVLVEDAAESLGSFYKGRHTGNWGTLSILSFNGNKTITTGGGGAILTNNEELGRLAKHITTTAKVPHQWRFDHDMVGYNYRMPNINAALGCAQMEQLDSFLVRKRALTERYRKSFLSMKGIDLFIEPDFAKSNYWLNALILGQEYMDNRDMLLELTNNKGIMTRPVWSLMNKLPMFQGCPCMDLSTAQSLEKRIVNIPSSVGLM